MSFRDRDKDRVSGIRRGNLLALIMTMVGLYSIYYNLANPDVMDMTDLFSKFLFVVLGITLFFDRKKNLMRAIGYYALALGLGRCITSMGAIGEESNFMFYYGMAMFALGVNLAYSGYNYLEGTSRNRLTLTASAIAMALGNIFLFVMTLISGTSLKDTVFSEFDTIATGLLYVIFLALLFSREVYKNIPAERIRLDLSDVKSNLYANSVHMSDENLHELCSGFESENYWDRIPGMGNYGFEKIFPVIMDGKTRYMIAQKIEGSDGIYLTIVEDPCDSFIGCMRFKVLSVVNNDDSSASLIDELGICMTVNTNVR